MPTVSKAQLIEPKLTAPGFYAEHDLPPPEENSHVIPTTDEEEELRQIASALTVAAASAAMPAGVFAATLLIVKKKPACSHSRASGACRVGTCVRLSARRRAPKERIPAQRPGGRSLPTRIGRLGNHRAPDRLGTEASG
jgi:hypothetical protein